ncbi:hypothetical protein [Flavobacterium sp.]|uniref:hypothetical protein n=1 Tax=Flavobacterium sp. TaxID=239 RepID=UPI0026045915|nr:hypothetical protein [Flavobacterium sp.]
MELHLINGQFSTQEAITLLTEMIAVKIKYHEKKIIDNHYEEDVKMREQKIKLLQNELAESRNYIQNQSGNINIKGTINIETNEK